MNDLAMIRTLQAEFDAFIIRHRKLEMTDREMLMATYIAYAVEIQEFEDALQLGDKREEAMDVLHFMISIFNQVLPKKEIVLDVFEHYDGTTMLEFIEATKVYKHWSSKKGADEYTLVIMAEDVIRGFVNKLLTMNLFKNIEEIQIGYAKKHSINYQRQIEGY